MDYTKQEILHSLDVIQTICCHTDCDECPFYEGGIGCIINNMSPTEWCIVDPDKQEIWRAFENH